MKYTKVTIQIDTDKKIPNFIGSQLRGALGYALKKVVCINPSYRCDECFAQDNCLYYDFYEKKNVSHKYRFDFELGKESYYFNLYIFDTACEKLPYIVSSFHKMLTQIGLGRDNIIYENFRMFVNDKSIYENNKIELPKKYIEEFTYSNLMLDDETVDINLSFITPLRMKKKGVLIKDDDFKIADIIKSIYQRNRQLIGLNPIKLDFEISGEIIDKDIKYLELTRKSNRQKTLMNFGGIVGSITIKNLNQKSYELLKLGELIGVGKQTVFGLGKIKIKKMEEV